MPGLSLRRRILDEAVGFNCERRTDRSLYRYFRMTIHIYGYIVNEDTSLHGSLPLSVLPDDDAFTDILSMKIHRYFRLPLRPHLQWPTNGDQGSVMKYEAMAKVSEELPRSLIAEPNLLAPCRNEDVRCSWTLSTPPILRAQW
jgi:hypothetical protein